MPESSLLDLDTELGQRVLRAAGRIESGQLANMRLYRRSSDIIHTRLRGEDRTLCGRSVYHAGQNAWQFVHNGRVGMSLPSGSDPGDRNACKQCSRSPVVRVTATIVAERHRLIGPYARLRA